jgi:hypothetical protein
MGDGEFKKYANEKKEDNSVLPVKENPESFSGSAGGALPIVGKGLIGAGAVGAVNFFFPELSPELSPAIGAWAMTVPEMTKTAMAQGKLSWFKRAKAEGKSDNEALDMAKKMSTIEGTESAITGTALNFIGAHSIPEGTGQGFVKSFGQWLSKQPQSSAEVSALSGAGQYGKDFIAKKLGYNITHQEQLDDTQKSITNMAVQQLAFNAGFGLLEVPKWVKAQSLEPLSKMPPEQVQQMSEQAVQSGQMTQDQATNHCRT